MPKDPNRVNHRGAQGLFDDIDDVSHAEEHELQDASRRAAAKEAKRAQRIARGKPAESKLSCLFAKVLSKRDKKDDGFEHFEDGIVSESITVTPEIKVTVPETKGYRYRDWDTGAVESPWLRECGMIRVKSNEPGGCRIVAKPFLLKDN